MTILAPARSRCANKMWMLVGRLAVGAAATVGTFGGLYAAAQHVLRDADQINALLQNALESQMRDEEM